MAKYLNRQWLFLASAVVEHMTEILRSMVQILPLAVGQRKNGKKFILTMVVHL